MAPINQENLDLKLLLQKIHKGQISLFLGAGINRGSNNSEGYDAPLAKDLALLIKDRFFPGIEGLPDDLAGICEYVELKENRRLLDQFIHEVLDDYVPSKLLKKIPCYKWRYIYTTNFDHLLEDAYQAVPEAIQKLRPIYSDRDVMSFTVGPDLPYFKLHGCITKIATPDLKMILTNSDYSNFTLNRHRLFQRLFDTLHDNTLLFIGYSLADSNFLALFNEVQSALGDIKEFPRCYAVMVNPSAYQVEIWDSRKVTILDMTASELFDLVATSQVEKEEFDQENVPEVINIPSSSSLDLEVAQELFRSFELVNDRLGYSKSNFEDFYQGNKPTWEIIKENGDAKRNLYDDLIDDVLFVDEAERPYEFEIVVITSEAGGGKTTLLMRLAYDYANLFDGFCLFHKSLKNIPVPIIEELYRVVGKRLFIFIDDAADNIKELVHFARTSRTLKLPCTVVCAERKNEWNAVADQLLPIVPLEFDIPLLSDEEIERILDVLGNNEYLCALKDMEFEERKAVFKEKAHKQLLVAMREATEGKDFDSIVQDEYDSIPSEQAKQTYLYICSLHRFGVPVRAGLLKRLSGVGFTEFREKLFEPLERVVTEEMDDDLDILAYRSRHPHIAEIVCKHAIVSENISKVYLEIIGKMDLGYASDLVSFRELVRADDLIDAIPSIEGRRLFFQRALLVSSGDAFVYQQFGIMEMRHRNFEEAESYLGKASQLEPRNHAYRHSYANLLFRQSQHAENPVQASKLFGRAESLVDDLIRWNPTNSYAYATYAESLIARSRLFDEVQKIEYLEAANDVISNGIRRCQDKAYLHSVHAQILDELGQSNEALRALKVSHDADPTSVRTALLLGWKLYSEEHFEAAEEVTAETLKYNPNHEALNLLSAKTAIILMPNEDDLIINRLKKAFDREYVDTEPNFLLAVQLFRAGRYSEAEEIFANFKMRKIYKASNKSMKMEEFLMDSVGQRSKYSGEVEILYEGRFGFLKADLIPTSIYFNPPRNVQIKRGDRVKFEIGFRYFGPTATNIEKS